MIIDPMSAGLVVVIRAAPANGESAHRFYLWKSQRRTPPLPTGSSHFMIEKVTIWNFGAMQRIPG
jgi:hypothetical protein